MQSETEKGNRQASADSAKNAIARISKWMSVHAEKIAELSLQKGVEESELTELENLTGKKLPPDFRELYLANDGLTENLNHGNYFYGMDFYPIKKIVAEYQKRKSVKKKFELKKTSKEIDGSNIFNPNRLCFGFDGSHTNLLLDLDPTSLGKYGQIIFTDSEYGVGILVAKSTTELLENFADDLEKGLYILSEAALEDDNHFLEADESIDIINWYNAERWKAFDQTTQS